MSLRDHGPKGSRWIYTSSGRRFWPLDARAQDVAIEDIATALSQQCRFGGHCARFYSVAQHCVHVAELLEQEAPEDALFGLLHDAAEAYLVDLPRPIKEAAGLDEYRRAESRIQAVILEALSVPPTPPRALAWADEILLATEVRDLMHADVVEDWQFSTPPLAERIDPWEPDKARCEFLSAFRRLTNDKHHQTDRIADAYA